MPNAATPMTNCVPNEPVLPVDTLDAPPVPVADADVSTGASATLAHSPAVHVQFAGPPDAVLNGHDDSPAGRPARHMTASRPSPVLVTICHCSGAATGVCANMAMIPASPSADPAAVVTLAVLARVTLPVFPCTRSASLNARTALALLGGRGAAPRRRQAARGRIAVEGQVPRRGDPARVPLGHGHG